MTQAVVVGAGLAGLSAARALTTAGVHVTVLEAADAPGGRVRTDVVDGVPLDRGFQILLPAYPELARLDLARLDLRPFRPGVFVEDDGRHDLLADPRQGRHAWQGLLAQRVLTAPDLARLAALTARALLAPDLRPPDLTTRAALAAFSPSALEKLFRPFLSGVFLEDRLDTSSRFFHLVWRCFALGGAALPARGVQALPDLLAEGLDVRTGQRVAAVRGPRVELEGGERIEADAVVVATDGDTAARLLPGVARPRWNSVTTWYFRPDEPPLRDPALVVRANRAVNSAVISEVVPRPVPVVQVSTPHPLAESDVRAELRALYGTATAGWEVLARREIPQALPAMPAPHPLRRPVRVGGGYVCGDHRDTSSIQGALFSGRRAARAVLTDLGLRERSD
ncbi:NAD(P)/FAD-dependent oxidoreductase [Actinosynnema mirum]|uniref:Amine oxidase n=1 Tax=Actinosynnema mirum (strain ATCC 29888 / DSM 43827 / JCM 3225 / NBRC 14064 / NCIMB 13271 / NRRL B-12336 / IMRU 3971 / 101) TaxID=446462 RepID=C6WS73_ACTMD|nr:NAD(P)/FAD-dependent oxidoreductase [Actinosynnema mirum]ACU38893.1 amine oxidase [Actinosynnema mirum DSM 43827]